MSVTNSSDLIGRASGGRKLVAVVHADMVGYSRLIGLDDLGTLERLRTLRRTLIDPAINEHGGRLVQTGGDSLLIVFDSIDGAVRCAVKIQQRVPNYDGDQPPDRAIRFRIGINIGDVIADGTDLHGDGVNVAVRLEAECPPGGICVSRAVRDHVHGRLDLVFDELGALSLKNITRPVEAFVLRLQSGDALGGVPVLANARAQLNRLSVVVLPFANLSSDPQQDYFVEGIAEELTAAISRVGWFCVVSRRSAAVYKGRDVDLRQVGRELGVRYLLEGSVRQAGKRVRITCQLIEAETGHHVWAQRFDDETGEIFALQDRVAEAVAAAIEPSLERAEIARVRAKPTESLDAYDLYLQSLPLYYSMTAEGCLQALALLRQAAVLDPNFALAKAHAVFCLTRQVAQGWGSPADRNEGVRLAREVLATGSTDPLALVCVVHALGLLAGDAAAALDVARRALALNPNSAWVQSAAGWANSWGGEPEAATAHFAKAIQLNPFDTDVAFSVAGLAIATLMLGRPREALSLAEQAMRAMPACTPAYRIEIAALVLLQQQPEARLAVKRFEAAVPTASRVFADRLCKLHRDQAFIKTLIAALREAGLQE